MGGEVEQPSWANPCHAGPQLPCTGRREQTVSRVISQGMPSLHWPRMLHWDLPQHATTASRNGYPSIAGIDALSQATGTVVGIPYATCAPQESGATGMLAV